MSEVWAALAGSALTGAVVLGVQFLINRHQIKRDAQKERTQRLVAFLGASHDGVLALTRLALAAEDSKDAIAQEVLAGRQDRMNTALNAIKLLEPPAVVDVVIQLDQALVTLVGEARKKQWVRVEWRAKREEVVDARVQDVLTAGRHYLGAA